MNETAAVTSTAAGAADSATAAVTTGPAARHDLTSPVPHVTPVTADSGGRKGKRKSNRGVAGFRPQALKDWRASCGMEQKELARRVGMSPGGVSHIESGKRLPSIDVVFRLADALSGGPDGVCNPDNLIDLEELKRTEPTMLARLVAELDPALLEKVMAAHRSPGGKHPARKRPARAGTG